MKRRLFVAAEEEGNTIPEELDIGLQQHIEETADVHEDTCELLDQVETGCEVVNTLDQTQDVLEDSLKEQEGATEGEMRVAAVVVDSIRVRLGLPKSAVTLPSLESFQNKETRSASTKLAIESISDTTKKILTGIREFIMKVWNTIKEFFKSIFSSREKAKADHEKIMNKLEEAKKSPKIAKEDSKIEVGEVRDTNQSLANFFSINKKANADTVEKMIERTSKLNETGLSIVHQFDEIFNKKHDLSDPKAFVELYNSIEKVMESISPGLGGSGLELVKVSEKDGVFHLERGPFPGAKTISADYSADVEDGDLVLNIRTGTYDAVTDVIDLAPSLEDTEKLMKSVMVNVINAEVFNKKLDGLFTKTEKMINEWDKKKLSEELSLPKLVSMVHKVVGFITRLTQITENLMLRLIAHVHQYCNHSIDYIQSYAA